MKKILFALSLSSVLFAGNILWTQHITETSTSTNKMSAHSSALGLCAGKLNRYRQQCGAQGGNFQSNACYVYNCTSAPNMSTCWAQATAHCYATN